MVQDMVDAKASGVLFTAKPMSGARDEIVLDASWGLGEGIVGGWVEPDGCRDDDELLLTCPGNLGPRTTWGRLPVGAIRVSGPPITRVRDPLQAVDRAEKPNRRAFSAGVAPARAM